MKKAITLFSIISLGVLSMPAVAHQYSSFKDRNNRMDRIEQHIERQHYRIREGINSGELTRREARRLRDQQQYIVRLSQRFMHDGYLDRYEFRELQKVLEHASQQIYRLKHNHLSRYARQTYFY
ncbi:hypothetical protein [Kaarinaea lacus]